ncbi:ATP-binding protein [Candidatus Bipolaricaulota bacterium]|nr:ATP-binding protein [Candidatus Bipolaricaulota bacterium]
MRITIASGKGGTGKTTVAINLALSLLDEHPIQFLDCDVEEPNAHIFLKPTIETRRSVDKLLPRVDPRLCDSCGACATSCEFNAIAVIGGKVLVYDDLCHGCGLCRMVCPNGAIREVSHELGVVESGTATGFPFAQGVLNVGEAMATPIIHELKAEIRSDHVAILDAPPGTGCPTIASLRDSDLALLVTEPTPFGLHDLKAAVGVARTLGIPAAVIINRDGIGDDRVARYCEEEGIPVLLVIPFDRGIASLCAIGTPLVSATPSWRARYQELFRQIVEVAS